MIGNYTQALSDLMWEQSAVDTAMDDDYQSVLNVLNSDSFRPFSIRLLAFVNELWGTEYDAETAAKAVLKSAKSKAVSINRNTTLNWFSGKSVPNMGTSSRERMYVLAFALGLTVEQTDRLFNKVLLDRAYNPRSILEFVYRYCLSIGKTYYAASDLLKRAEALLVDSDSPAETLGTQQLEAKAIPEIDEEELLAVIAHYRHNFVLSDVRAKAEVENLLNKTRGALALSEYKAHHQSENIDRDLLGRDTDSVDFLLYVIKDQEIISKRTKGIPSLPDMFPEEIANDFPDKSTFSLKDPSSYILRKEIIFLYFYYYWATISLSNQSETVAADLYDEFKENLNQRLENCGLSPLYAGNPYDWMFLYCACAASEDLTPLDVFRGILSQLNPDDEGN